MLRASSGSDSSSAALTGLAAGSEHESPLCERQAILSLTGLPQVSYHRTVILQAPKHLTSV